MSVTKIVTYRVDVGFRLRTWELFGDSKKLDEDLYGACKGSSHSGIDQYSAPIVWAEFDNEAAAVTCDSLLRNVAERWNEKAAKYDAREEHE